MELKTDIVLFNFENTTELEKDLISMFESNSKFNPIFLTDVDEAVSYFENSPRVQFIFKAQDPREYLKVKSILQTMKESGLKLLSIGIISNADDADTLASLRNLNCKKVFSLRSPASDIFDFTFSRQEDIEKAAISILEPKAAINPKDQIVKEKSYDDALLESGKLSIHFDESEFKLKDCKLEHFEDKLIELDIIGDINLNLQDNVNFDIIFEYMNCKVQIKIDGVIEEIEVIEKESKSSLVSIKLNNFDSANLESFMTLYSKRQKSIDEFMSLAKGT